MTTTPAPGDMAPDFTLIRRTPEGFASVRLSDLRGRNVILFFIPFAGSGVCTTEMCAISDDWSSYEKLDAEVFGISADSPYMLHLWAVSTSITVPLLSDFNHDAINAFGIVDDNFTINGILQRGVAKRSVFVIDREGMVVYADVMDSANDLPDLEKVKEEVANL